MPVRCGVDELQVDPHPVPRSLHAALQDGRHPQFRGDLGNALAAIAVLHHRGTGYHQQRADLAKLRQDVFVDAVGEVEIVRQRAAVFERQHRNGRAGRGRRAAPVVRGDEIPQRHQQQRQDDIVHSSPGSPAKRRRHRRSIRLATNTLGRPLEKPRDGHCNREPERQDNQDDAPDGERQLTETDDDVGHLGDQPGTHQVKRRNAQHVAAPDFGKQRNQGGAFTPGALAGKW